MKNTNLKLTIGPKKIIYCIIFFTILCNPLMAELGASFSITYLNDFFWIVLLLFLVRKGALTKIKRQGLPSTRFVIILFATVLAISAVVNFVNPFLVIWATRNTLRFYVFYIACVYYLTIDDIDRIMKIFYYVQILNFVFALYQYFGLGLYKDNLGGIFGHGNGQALNTFQTLLYGYFLAGYFLKKKPIAKLVVIAFTSLVIAAMAEEKGFFVYFLITTIVVVIFSKTSFKTAFIVICCVVLLSLAFNILVDLNGIASLNILLNKTALLEYAENSYGISRIDPFTQITKMFFGDSVKHKVFGLGFGYTESSGISLFTSPFYQKYAYLQYTNFTTQKRFLETGYIGFISFLLLFLDNVRLMWRLLTKDKRNDYQAIAILAFNIVAILSCWFSGALVVKDAYLVYFGVSIAGIIALNKKANNHYEDR